MDGILGKDFFLVKSLSDFVVQMKDLPSETLVAIDRDAYRPCYIALSGDKTSIDSLSKAQTIDQVDFRQVECYHGTVFPKQKRN